MSRKTHSPGRGAKLAVAACIAAAVGALSTAGAGASLGPVEIVSVNSAGDPADSAGNYLLDVSVDARFVLFASSATNLVSDDDNGTSDVFLRDRVLGTTERVVEDASAAAISGDGRFVLYAASWPSTGLRLLDRQAGATVPVTSVRTFSWAISDDASTIAFVTNEQLLPSDNDAMDDIYFYDRATATLELPPLSMNPATPYYGGGGPISLSGDGSAVGFVTHVPLTTPDDCCTWDVFAHDRDTGITTRVSATPSGGSGSSSGPVTISGDGRTVAFVGGSLLPDTAHYGLYRYDLETSTLSYVSGYVVGGLSLSWDGRYLGYQHALTGLLMLEDRDAGTVEPINIQSDGSPGFNGGAVVVAGDGSDVAFASMGVFVPSAPFGYQVYVRATTSAPDTTPPTLALPDDITRDATGPDGTVVEYSVTGTDDRDPYPLIECAPPSASSFEIGTATVTCTAADASGNVSAGSFTVTVLGADEQLEALIELVDGYELEKLGTSLHDKLVSAQRHLVAGRLRQAEESIAAFVAEVEAQRWKGLTEEQVDALVGAADRIVDVIEA